MTRNGSVHRFDLEQYLNQSLNIKEFSDYCPNGLQVEGKPIVERLAIGVTASLWVIEQAIAAQADALLVHHGLFWKGDDPTICGPRKARIAPLLEHDLSLLAYHLPLDAHPAWGNNWEAARALGLRDLQGFGSLPQQKEKVGVQGTIAPLPLEQWHHRLAQYYGQPGRLAPGGDHPVTRIGLISGGAHRSLVEAAQAGLDCFVTGSGDEPVWHQAKEWNIHFIAMGHSATEIVGPRSLGSHLADHFGIEVVELNEKNPF